MTGKESSSNDEHESGTIKARRKKDITSKYNDLIADYGVKNLTFKKEDVPKLCKDELTDSQFEQLVELCEEFAKQFMHTANSRTEFGADKSMKYKLDKIGELFKYSEDPNKGTIYLNKDTADGKKVISAFLRYLDLPVDRRTLGRYRLNKSDPGNLPLIALAATFNGAKRTTYNREYDRIIVTDAFRRMQYKTQILTNESSDVQRTRMMHSLEVQKIAKTLALQLGANWELAEAIAIAHDIGHAPFGHSGEAAIDNYLSLNFFGRFAHALQSVKVLNHLETHAIPASYGLRGIMLSNRVLRGVLQHDTDMFSEDIASAGYYLQYHCPELYVQWKSDSKKELLPVIPDDNDDRNIFLPIGNLESQIVHWADKIAYCGHDWDEYSNFGFLDRFFDRVTDIVERMHRIVHRFGKDEKTEILGPNGAFTFSKCEYEYILKVVKELNTLTGYLKLDDTALTLGKSFCDDDDGKKKFMQSIDKIIARTETDIKIKKFDRHNVIKGNHDDDHVPFEIFSAEEYSCFVDFFAIAQVWLKFTELFPVQTDSKTEICYVLYKYLKSINGNLIEPLFQDHLLTQARENGIDNTKNTFSKEDAIVLKCTSDFKKSVENAGSDKKGCFRSSMVVTLPKEYICKYDHNKSVNILQTYKDFDDFKAAHFYSDVVVSTMNDKAGKIVGTIFDHFLEHPDQLPHTWRTRDSLEKDTDEIREHVETWLNTFITERLKEVYKMDADFNSGEYGSNDFAVALRDADIEKKVPDNKSVNTQKELIMAVQNFSDFLVRTGRKIKESSKLKKGDCTLGFNEFVKRTITARVIADYIACMTDRTAQKVYDDIISGRVQWHTEEKY
jgi:predicted deoxyguanosinetriphosphate triphosphohydrolase